MDGPAVESEPAKPSAIVPAPRPPITLPNSPEQRQGLQELGELLRTVAEYFSHKDVPELAEQAERWSKRVFRLLDDAKKADR